MKWPYDTRRWRKLRKEILARDDHRCQRCGIPGNRVHHIQDWMRDGGDVWDPENLQVVCFACHERMHGRENRPPTPGRAEWDAWLTADPADT